MAEVHISEAEKTLHLGSIVAPADDLASVQSPEGDQIPVLNLGPGVVEELAHESKVRVRWLDAQFSTWLHINDLKPYDPATHLISLYSRSRDGKMTVLSRRLVSHLGLQNNWTVELLPDSIVRAIRADGQAWTFGYRWMDGKIQVWWPQPPRDEDAEAFVAAEIAVSRQEAE